jgi:hypothetical protein
MQKPVYSKLMIAGFAFTSLGIISRVSIRWPLVEEKVVQGEGWSSWEPSRCLDWSPLTLGLFLLGSLVTLCGVSLWGSSAALSKVAGYGLASLIVPWIVLASPLLRCIAVIPLFTAILIGFVLLLVALFRFVWMRWLCRGR